MSSSQGRHYANLHVVRSRKHESTLASLKSRPAAQQSVVFSAVNSHIPKLLAASSHVSVNGDVGAFSAVAPSASSGGAMSRPLAFAVPLQPPDRYDMPQKLSQETADALYHEYLARYAEEIGLPATEAVLASLESDLPQSQVLTALNWKTQGSKVDDVIIGAKPSHKVAQVGSPRPPVPLTDLPLPRPPTCHSPRSSPLTPFTLPPPPIHLPPSPHSSGGRSEYAAVRRQG